ncbi:hypothetical protein CJ179_34270 [Rhodococcus sp. ACS1]|uniref:hypothetical protein n=1 Tax=Rhodococcus TaxID=1827 RepID=UPI000BB1483D|nr:MULTISPECIES: hypothetical protein [Rhodococcus]PBC40123.1 hypothetical protein CJ179_34270 [Rhodococcus sp. ACS1]QSE84928.1 hypothetical protein JWS14_40575 [Rhodococcus koreensis]
MREIDAAGEVARDVPEVEIPHEGIDRACDAISMSAASIVDPVVEQIGPAVIGGVVAGDAGVGFGLPVHTGV